MTTTTKKTRTAKNSGGMRAGIPASAGITIVDGRKFVIMPLEDFEDWRDEQLFAALVHERLESAEVVVPFADIVDKLNKGGKGG